MQRGYQDTYQPYQSTYQPYQTQPPKPQPAGMFYWVRGFNEADHWPVTNSERVVLLDELEDVMYIRTHDKRGMPVTIIYDLSERKPPMPVDMSNLEQLVIGIIERRFGQQSAAQEVQEHGEQDV